MKARLTFLTTIFAAALMLAFAAGTQAAKPKSVPSPVSDGFTLPETARQVSPNVYYLGAVEHNGRTAEGYAFVDNRGRNAKPVCGDNQCEPGENANKCPADCGGGGPSPTPEPTPTPSDTSGCYGFLADGAKWKSVEPWVVNPSNPSGMSESSVLSTLSSAIGDWENAASFNILGGGTTTTQTLVADTSSPDDQNEVYLGEIADSSTIGVTIVWGYFRGHPSWRELIEWDQIYNESNYDWSEDCTAEDCTAKMDFPNIAIHELGHSVGLDDLYDSTCSEMTMYGYGTEGETKKRDLEDGDINGVSTLY